MAESFTNALGRAVGVVTTATGGSIGIQTNKVTGISTTGIGVSAIVDNQHYIAGTKVLNFGTAAQEVVFDRDSINTAARVESYGMPSKFHMSEKTFELINQNIEHQKKTIEIKGKGLVETVLI